MLFAAASLSHSGRPEPQGRCHDRNKLSISVSFPLHSEPCGSKNFFEVALFWKENFSN